MSVGGRLLRGDPEGILPQLFPTGVIPRGWEPEKGADGMSICPICRVHRTRSSDLRKHLQTNHGAKLSRRLGIREPLPPKGSKEWRKVIGRRGGLTRAKNLALRQEKENVALARRNGVYAHKRPVLQPEPVLGHPERNADAWRGPEHRLLFCPGCSKDLIRAAVGLESAQPGGRHGLNFCPGCGFNLHASLSQNV